MHIGENGNNYCCKDFANLPDFPGCCDSCHDDIEYDTFYLITIYDRKGNEANVCCFVSSMIEDKLGKFPDNIEDMFNGA